MCVCVMEVEGGEGRNGRYEAHVSNVSFRERERESWLRWKVKAVVLLSLELSGHKAGVLDPILRWPLRREDWRDVVCFAALGIWGKLEGEEGFIDKYCCRSLSSQCF